MRLLNTCSIYSLIDPFRRANTFAAAALLLLIFTAWSLPSSGSEESSQASPRANDESLPPPSPAPGTMLQGQVEEFNNNLPPSNSYSRPYNGNSRWQNQDPFGLQPPESLRGQQPSYGEMQPATPPGREVPDLKGLIQAFMGLGLQSGQLDMPPVNRPAYIPGYAYTNEHMVAPYHNLDVAWWDKSRIPDKQKWIKLSESVTRYWRGQVPDPCLVLLNPLKEAPGNFTFATSAPSGPRGWLQFTGATDHMGFPLYRYWFDSPSH